MAINSDGMVICDLGDDSESKVRRRSRTSDDQVQGSMLEQRWQHLWVEGKKTPGVVNDRNPLENPPDWFNLPRFTKAQKVAKKYYFR